MSTFAALAGAALVLLILVEAFEALVFPRRVTRPFRLSRYYYRAGWHIWQCLSRLASTPRARTTTLSVFGPLSLLVLFALWAAGLIAGFGLLHYAAAGVPLTLSEALYLSGTTFSTLGYGDLTPTSPASRVLAVAEAACGFGYFAVVIGYLPVLYQAFSAREAFIALLDARAGSPPTAGRLLLRVPPAGDGAALRRFLDESERWAAVLLESQLSFPVLGYYRSQHDNQSWVAALACALDAGALLLTVVEGADRQQARLTFAMARHVAVDLAMVLRRTPRSRTTERLSDARLDELLAALRSAGATVRADAAARAKLAELRGLYEPFIAALAGYFCLELPPVWPETEGPDNWQTSAWMRRAGGLGSLGTDRRDEHFD